jgi:hypothetical protein
MRTNTEAQKSGGAEIRQRRNHAAQKSRGAEITRRRNQELTLSDS